MTNWKNILSWRNIIILIISAFGVLPVGFYIWHFGFYPISDDPSDWGLFGDYIGGIYGGFFSCILIILAIYITRSLSKKDQRQIKTSNAAETIYKQINVIENNGYNLNSINKYFRDIKANELYFDDKTFVEQLVKLYDQFIEHNAGTGVVDIDLRNYVMTQLQDYYVQ